MVNLPHFIRRQRLFNFKNLLFFSTAILTFVFLSAASYQIYSSTVRLMVKKSEESNVSMLNQINKTLESNLLQIERMTGIIAGSSTLIEYIKQYERSPQANRIQIRTNIQAMLLKFQGFNRHIFNIYVLTEHNVFQVGGTTSLITTADLPDLDFHRFLTGRASGETPFFFEPNRIDYTKPGYSNLQRNGYEHFFGSLIRDPTIASGTVLVVLNPQLFDNLLNHNPHLLVLNQDNQLLWKGDDITAGDMETARQLSAEEETSGIRKIQAQSEIGYKLQSGFHPVKLVYIQKSASVAQRIDLLKMVLFTVYAIMIVLSLIFAQLLSRKIVTPIRKLLRAVNQYRNGDTDREPYMKSFPRVTLRENVMYFIIVMTMTPIVLFSLFSYYYVNKEIEDYLFESNESTFNQVSGNLDHYFEIKKKVIYTIAFDMTIQKKVLDSPLDSPVNYFDLIDDYLRLDIGRDDIFIYQLDKTIVLTNTNSAANTTVTKETLDSLDLSNETFAWLNTQKDAYGRYATNLIVKITDVTNFQHIGYMQCQISAFELENIYKLAVNTDSDYYIVDANDNIVSHPDTNKINTTLRLDSADHFIFDKPIAETPWRIVGSYRYSNIKEEMKQIAYQQIYTVIIIFLVVIGIAYVISLRITSSLRHMNTWLGMVGIDNMDVDFPPHMQIHEIGELAHSFNEMVRRIESLIDELLISTKKQVDLENKKKNAELIALQSQINPHFLYNTFDNINWLIKSGDKENALQMVTALSHLLRYSSKSDRLVVTVAEEIQHIQSYMDIMQIRFSEQISLQLNIREAFMSHRMIKLTLQPIIENAIYHAIAPKQQGGSIKVKIYAAPDSLVIKVLDDGVGLTKAQAEELNRNLQKEGYPERIGLYNVQTRIRLFFGNKYGLRIKSRLGKGTIVEIHLPGDNETPNIANKF